MHDASKNLGFIYVKNHGIQYQTIENIRHDAFKFFRKDDNVKAEIKISNKHRGWLGYGQAKMDDGAKPDLKVLSGDFRSKWHFPRRPSFERKKFMAKICSFS